MSRDPNEKRQPGVVDRTAYNYGGDPNAANDQAAKLAAEANLAQSRQGEQINTGSADAARAQGQETRGQALSMADMMRARAMGQVPSIAGMRANQDMGRVAAEQSSAQASARGPAGMALAQQGAAANTAGAQSAISNAAQINTAQERMQAEQAAYGAYSGLRQGDQAQQGQDFGQSQAQAALNAQQRAQNDAYATNARQQGIGIQMGQLGADMNRDQQEQAGHFNAAGLQAQKNAENDANMMGYIGMAPRRVEQARRRSTRRHELRVEQRGCPLGLRHEQREHGQDGRSPRPRRAVGPGRS
jgi:hypothetical protein